LPSDHATRAPVRPAVDAAALGVRYPSQIITRAPWAAGAACRPPASTQRAQSEPRPACALYVSISMQVNDWGRVSTPRASTGRAQLS